jgi:hypothetical protein
MVKVLWYSILVSSCIFVESFLCPMVVTPTRLGEAKGIVSFHSPMTFCEFWMVYDYPWVIN